MNAIDPESVPDNGILQQALPWLAGAGFALSHIAMSGNCTLPREGRCSSCGGCVVALGTIVAWGVLKKRAPVLDVGAEGDEDVSAAIRVAVDPAGKA